MFQGLLFLCCSLTQPMATLRPHWAHYLPGPSQPGSEDVQPPQRRRPEAVCCYYTIRKGQCAHLRAGPGAAAPGTAFPARAGPGRAFCAHRVGCPQFRNPSGKGGLFSRALNTISVLRFIIKKTQIVLPGVCLSFIPIKESGRGGILSWSSLLSGRWESDPIHGYSNLGGFLGALYDGASIWR